MPEFFRSRFPKAANPISYRLAAAPGEAVDRVRQRGHDRQRAAGRTPAGPGRQARPITVILNSPDLGLFDPAAPSTREFMADGTLRIVYTGRADADVRTGRGPARRGGDCPPSPDLPVRPRSTAVATLSPALEALAAELRDRRSSRVPGPHPDRGRAGGRSPRRHRRRAHAPGSVHRHEPLHEGARVRGDGQARRGLASAHRRALLRRGHSRALRAGRS
jgi:hypothetical protein